MNERTKTGLEILSAALLIGVLGNVLLRVTPWGLNAFVFVAIFTAAMITITARRRPELLTFRTLALQGAMVFFGAMFVIRDSIELRVYDTFAIVIIMGVLVLPNFGINARIAGAFHYAVGFIWSGISSLLAPFVLLGADIEWKAMPGNRLSKNIFAVLRGLAIALPLVLVFGALFMAADAAYEGMVNRAINFDLNNIISHVILTSVFAWLTAGYFRGTLVEHFRPSAPIVSPIPKDEPKDAELRKSESGVVSKFSAEPSDGERALPNNATILDHINQSDPPNGARTLLSASETESSSAAEPKTRDWQNWDNTRFPQVFTLGTVETVIILGLVDLLFVSFVAVQIPYLFGGMDLVQTTPDFKLAEYARRGFGELVAVSALVLPMLLASHWLLRRDNVRNENIFRALAGFQIVLLFVIMASAVQRLVLLTGELGYGMTTIRFYPMVFMLWLAVVFVWFAVTVLRGARQHFAWGALWSAIVILGATNLFNPDAFIVKTNIALMHQGRDFDARYNSNDLSDDAIPQLIEALPTLNPDDQCWVKWKLHVRMNETKGESDVRSWNISRSVVRERLQSNHASIESNGACEPHLNFDEY
ncbi:MAG: DUF4153 domain-containing protein [Pyrinomonadaceae bacterium]